MADGDPLDTLIQPPDPRLFKDQDEFEAALRRYVQQRKTLAARIDSIIHDNGKAQLLAGSVGQQIFLVRNLKRIEKIDKDIAFVKGEMDAGRDYEGDGPRQISNLESEREGLLGGIDYTQDTFARAEMWGDAIKAAQGEITSRLR